MVLLRGITFLLFFTAINAIAQYPFYKNFTIDDGLPSNKIYNIIEDKKGFIWISTNQGVSRFDGINFVNFTTKDGLPDNEILGLFEDNKGRIWFNSYSTEPCFYLDGKIYNDLNDSFLQRIKANKPKGPCLSVLIKSNNSIAFYIIEKNVKYLVGKEISDIKILDQGFLRGHFEQKILYRNNNTNYILSSFEIISWLNGDSIQQSKKEKWQKFNINYTAVPSKYIVGLNSELKKLGRINTLNNETSFMDIDEKYNKLFITSGHNTLVGDSVYAIINDSFSKIIESYSLPFSFDRINIDRKGNKWFGSSEKGLYLIRKQAPMTIDIPEPSRNGILGIEYLKNKGLIIKTENKGLLLLDHQTGTLKTLFYDKKRGRILGFALVNKHALVGSDGGLFKIDDQLSKPLLLSNISIKDIEYGLPNEILIGGASIACIYSYYGKDSLRTLEKTRTTAICRLNDSIIWLGGLNGIRSCNINNSKTYTISLKLENELDNSRIVDIKRDQKGNMWIATDQKGLFFCPLKGAVQRISSMRNQILSDVCYQILIDEDNRVFLATAEGIAVVKYNTVNELFITNYSRYDGLPGKIINSLALCRDTLFIATPNGLYCFLKPLTASRITNETVITQIKVNGQLVEYSELTLPYDHNNLIISYASSFINSGIDYRFRYRIKEIDQIWIETNTTQLSLLGLKPSSYTFEISAINALGKAGKISVFKFAISTPWFKQWWFFTTILIIVFSSLAYYFVLMKERVVLTKNLTLLKLRILRAQMNPHFVFNALSNVQRLVQIRDLNNAETYIGKLSSVLRNSIEYSGREFIELSKEIDYTQSYLDIEKLRFNEKFDYFFNIHIEAEELDQIYVPPMILQPMIENALKHAYKGIRHKGNVTIIVEKIKKETIRYTIKDNGNGFDVDKAIQINHGLNITKSRIEMLYKSLNLKSTFSIQSNESLDDGGTTIIIEFPIIKD